MASHHYIRLLSIVFAVGWIVFFSFSAQAGWDNNPLFATNGTVNTVAVDGIGNIYIGGSFTSVGNPSVTANNIAKWNGTSWDTLGGGLNGPVNAIAVYGSNVYAAGTFTNKVACWNGTSWQYLLIIGSPDFPISGTVYALAIDGSGRLYAGGDITNPPSKIIEWSGGNWGPVSGIPTSGYVSALAINGSVLYAGRSAIIGVEEYIYYLSGTTMVPLTSTINSNVTAMTYAGGKLYAGGAFTSPGNYIAVWDGLSWSALGSGVGSTVTAIAVDTTDNIVYAGESSASYMTAWNLPGHLGNWSAVSGVDDQINAFAYHNSRVYAGGNFTAPTSSIGMYSVNLPPKASNNSYNTNEDTPISGNVLTDTNPDGADTDPEGTTLTAVLVTAPSAAATESFTLNPDGSFTYTPKLNFNGTVSFTYKAVDATSKESSPAAVMITVNAVNDAPVANNDSYIASEDTLLTVAAKGVLENDTDVDSSTFTAVLDIGPSHAASFALNANGSFTYKASANYNGTDTFTYYAKDSDNAVSNTATVTITVGAVNDPPVANPDSYSTDEDTSLSIAVANGVLNNDSDIDSASLTAVLAGNPAHGTVTLNSNGSFTYTPSANYNGTDTFRYYAKDNLNAISNTATVSITINPINDAPVANPDTYLIAQNTILNIPAPGVLANDVDIENNTLNAILVADAAHGHVVLNSDGSFTYTPASNYFGPDSFTYKANDGQAQNSDSAIATVNIHVDVPVPSMVSVSDITATTVLLTGNSNTQTASERGFFWWTNYDSSGLISSGSAGMGNFSLKPTNLKPNTSYNVSAYIKVGTQVITSANKLTFTTTDPLPPSVITGSLFSVIGQDITATGEITNIGSTPVTIYGFVYNTSPYPTVWNKALPFTWDTSLPLSAGKTFSGTIRNLPAGKYYLRAYANNSFGTTYGEQIEFNVVEDIVSSPSMPGDVNGDGAVDLEDAIIVLHILSGISVNVQIHLEADVNGDKRIGIEELAYILQKTAALR